MLATVDLQRLNGTTAAELRREYHIWVHLAERCYAFMLACRHPYVADIGARAKIMQDDCTRVVIAITDEAARRGLVL